MQGLCCENTQEKIEQHCNLILLLDNTENFKAVQGVWGPVTEKKKPELNGTLAGKGLKMGPKYEEIHPFFLRLINLMFTRKINLHIRDL